MRRHSASLCMAFYDFVAICPSVPTQLAYLGFMTTVSFINDVYIRNHVGLHLLAQEPSKQDDVRMTSVTYVTSAGTSFFVARRIIM